jgi:hypothetical protein
MGCNAPQGVNRVRGPGKDTRAELQPRALATGETVALCTMPKEG